MASPLDKQKDKSYFEDYRPNGPLKPGDKPTLGMTDEEIRKLPDNHSLFDYRPNLRPSAVSNHNLKDISREKIRHWEGLSIVAGQGTETSVAANSGGDAQKVEGLDAKDEGRERREEQWGHVPHIGSASSTVGGQQCASTMIKCRIKPIQDFPARKKGITIKLTPANKDERNDPGVSSAS